MNINGNNVTEGDLETLTELKAALVGTAAKLRLYQSSFTPTRQKVYADFLAAEATFTGYAAVAIVWDTPGLDSTGLAFMGSNAALFQATDAVTPNQIGGIWVSVDIAGPGHKVLAWYPFLNPVSMTVALATIIALVKLPMQGWPGNADATY